MIRPHQVAVVCTAIAFALAMAMSARAADPPMAQAGGWHGHSEG